jgi:hypothetical protein
MDIVVKRSAEVASYLEGMEAAWTQSLEPLDAYVARTSQYVFLPFFG